MKRRRVLVVSWRGGETKGGGEGDFPCSPIWFWWCFKRSRGKKKEGRKGAIQLEHNMICKKMGGGVKNSLEDRRQLEGGTARSLYNGGSRSGEEGGIKGKKKKKN